jgi:hypothetical protein
VESARDYTRMETVTARWPEGAGHTGYGTHAGAAAFTMPTMR